MDIIGTNTIGSNNAQLPSDSKLGCRFLSSQKGTVNKIIAYVRETVANKNGIAGIYSDNNGEPNALLGYSNAVTISTSPSWIQFDLISDVNLESNTYYWLSIIAESAIYYYYDSGVTNQYVRNLDAYGDGFKDPFLYLTDSRVWANIDVSIYTIYIPITERFVLSKHNKDMRLNLHNTKIILSSNIRREV